MPRRFWMSMRCCAIDPTPPAKNRLPSVMVWAGGFEENMHGYSTKSGARRHTERH